MSLYELSGAGTQTQIGPQQHSITIYPKVDENRDRENFLPTARITNVNDRDNLEREMKGKFGEFQKMVKEEESDFLEILQS